MSQVIDWTKHRRTKRARPEIEISYRDLGMSSKTIGAMLADSKKGSISSKLVAKTSKICGSLSVTHKSRRRLAHVVVCDASFPMDQLEEVIEMLKPFPKGVVNLSAPKTGNSDDHHRLRPRTYRRRQRARPSRTR